MPAASSLGRSACAGTVQAWWPAVRHAVAIERVASRDTASAALLARHDTTLVRAIFPALLTDSASIVASRADRSRGSIPSWQTGRGQSRHVGRRLIRRCHPRIDCHLLGATRAGRPDSKLPLRRAYFRSGFLETRSARAAPNRRSRVPCGPCQRRTYLMLCPLSDDNRAT